MWMLDNQTPFEAERTWVRDKDGVHHWIVVVKATYDISLDGTLSLAAKPLAPLYASEYNGADGESSLRYEADLVAMKPGTDIYLNAIAYAPGGEPCKKVKVSCRVGQMYKELLVLGERTWRRSLSGRVAPSSPEPFLKMPITYERAFGGFDQEHPDPRKHRIDFRNPVGSGVAFRKRRLVGKPAPSIVNPARKSGKGWPAGFGAIASFWSPRKDLAGTYDDKWMAQRQPLLPEDYDPKCLLCSPLDQQVSGYLKGGEPVELTNLTPSGRLRFTLPAASQHFETYFGSTLKEHVSELVSVIIESEGPRLILVWQTSLRCGNDADYLDRTVIYPKESSC
jgi:hypothetical protein